MPFASIKYRIINKSKVVIFSKGRQANYSFVLNDQTLDIESDYKYLGVVFSKSGSFYSAKKQLVNQAEKAMYSLIRKSRSLMLPFDLQIELYEKMVKPIRLYGSEVWGFGNLELLERSVLKLILHVSGPPAKLSYVVYRTAYSLYTFENNSSNKFK